MKRILNDLKKVKNLFFSYLEDIVVQKQAKDVSYIYDSIFKNKTKDEIIKKVKSKLTKEILNILNRIEEVGYLSDRIAPLQNTPTISVIVPHVNEYKFLDEALFHLTTQTDLPDEVIIVDDISDDFERVKKVVNKYTNVLNVKLLQNKGHRFFPGNARQHGIENATSDIVVLHDCDDISHKNRIEFTRKFFDIHREAIQLDIGHIRFKGKFFNYLKEFDSNNINRHIVNTDKIKTAMKDNFVKQLFSKPNHYKKVGLYGVKGDYFFGVHDSSTSFRRDVSKYFKQSTPDDFTFTKHETYDFTFMLFLLGQKSFQIDLPLMHYRVGYVKNRKDFNIY